MVRVIRHAPPQILTNKAATWTAELLRENDPGRKKTIVKRYSNRQIQKALRDMFHEKCAFCERKLTRGAPIEHFRPRKTYPHLTFEWTNLLWACGTCNGYKSDKFPATRTGDSIIDPSFEDPTPHLKVIIDYKTQWVSIYGTDERGELTVELVQLNNTLLRQIRFDFIRKLQFIARKASDDLEAKEIFDDAFEDEAEFLACTRALVHLPNFI